MRKQLNFDTKLENVIANVIVTNYIKIELLFRIIVFYTQCILTFVFGLYEIIIPLSIIMYYNLILWNIALLLYIEEVKFGSNSLYSQHWHDKDMNFLG